MPLDAALLDEAKAFGVNIARAAEQGVAAALKTAKAGAWKRENAKAIRSWNDYVAKNGLPLEEYRLF